jgi:hypothetical protein
MKDSPIKTQRKIARSTKAYTEPFGKTFQRAKKRSFGIAPQASFSFCLYVDKRTISVMTTMANTANPTELVTSKIRFNFWISSITSSLTFYPAQKVALHLYTGEGWKMFQITKSFLQIYAIFV